MPVARRNRAQQSQNGPEIAFCAEDESLRARIAQALALGGYAAAVAAETIDELVEQARDTAVELQILAGELESTASDEQAATLRAAFPDVPLIVVAASTLGAACRRLVREQVDGLVHEAELEQTLVPTVAAVLADQLCLPSSMRETVAEPVFSHREKQVLALVFAGLTNAEIAGELFLSESTVKSHLASTFRKLGVSSRTDAARRVLGTDPELKPRVLALGGPQPLVA